MDHKLTKKRVGATKHCVYGDCNSDSRPGRPGFQPNLRFFPFPKTCSSFRKSDVNSERIRNLHISTCPVCNNCDMWVRNCRRSDKKFKSIANITKDTYICSAHFPETTNMTTADLPLPLPSSEIIIMGIKEIRKRTSLEEKYVQIDNPNKKLKMMECDNVIEVKNVIEVNNVIEAKNVIDVKNVIEVNNDDGKTRTISTQTRTISTQTTFTSCDEISLKAKITELQEKVKSLKNDMKNKRKKKDIMIIFENKIKKNDQMCLFYTGFVYTQLDIVLKFISCENITYWGCDKKNFNIKARKYSQMQELILTLVRLRSGLLVKDIAYRFNLSTGLVSNIFTTWIQLMYHKFSTFRSVMFSSREKIQEHLPACFSKLTNVSDIIDCAEIFLKMYKKKLPVIGKM